MNELTSTQFKTLLEKSIAKGYVLDAQGNLSHPSRRAVAAGAGAVPEQAPGAASHDGLQVGQADGNARRKRLPKSRSGPILRVAFVAFARRRAIEERDDDNRDLGLGDELKPARDAVARYFGLDDHQSTIRWEYHIVETSGQEGVIVRIEAI